MSIQHKHKQILAFLLAAGMLAGTAGCGPSTWTPPGDETGYSGVFSLPFDAADGTALIQPGSVSAYSWNASEKPKVQIWYDNADCSTGLCLDTYEMQAEETKRGLDLSQQYVSEFYSRLINTTRDFAGSDRISLFTLSGAHSADLEEAANNSVVWAPASGSTDPSKPDFYVRSLEMEPDNTEGAAIPFKDYNGKNYTILSEGVLRQLYAQGGKITDESFAGELNVVFSDIADVDLTSTELAELVAARLKNARANGDDVSLYCVGVKLPYSGWITVPDRVSSLNSMKIYRQGYKAGLTRTYYFLISGPTAVAKQYTLNLIANMEDNIPADTSNRNGFAPQSLFVMDEAAEEPESGEGEETPKDRVILLVPDAEAESSKKPANAKKGRNADSSEAAAETTTTASEAPVPAESDYRTHSFLFAEEADMLACFRGSDVGNIAAYAEKQSLNWKQYMSCVYLEKEGAVSYPAELLMQLRVTEKSEIIGAKLYQASLEKKDKKGKELSCTWQPVSADEFDATGHLVQLQNEVYVKFNKQAPSETYAWMLEIDLADRLSTDPAGLIDETFLTSYTTADVKNSSYFTAMNLGAFAETILASRDQRVTEKYYVLFLLKHTPTLARNTGAANRRDAEQSDSAADSEK